MAKRFIDTDLWKRGWFRQLPPKMKTVWVYLITNCDHAGIYEVDIDLMSFMVGQKITQDEIITHLGNQISVINSGSKWFLHKFIKFQYGELNEKVKAHKSVLSLIEKYDIDISVNKGLSNPLVRVQDKDKDIDKDKNKEKKSKKEKKIETIPIKQLQEEFIEVDVSAEYKKFCDYCEANGKRYKNYHAAFRNWLRSEWTPKTDKFKKKKQVQKNQIDYEQLEKDADPEGLKQFMDKVKTEIGR